MDITINLTLCSVKDMFLYERVVAIPEACRHDVLHSLLELAIDTPAHMLARVTLGKDVAEHSQAETVVGKAETMVGNEASPGESDPKVTWTRRFSFRHSRPADAKLLEHFDLIPPGSRRKRLRSLLTMAFMIEQSALAGGALPSSQPISPRVPVIAPPVEFSVKEADESFAAPAGNSLVIAAPAVQEAAPAHTPQNSSADLALLFGAMTGG